jgi:hypothetical protein
VRRLVGLVGVTLRDGRVPFVERSECWLSHKLTVEAVSNCVYGKSYDAQRFLDLLAEWKAA